MIFLVGVRSGTVCGGRAEPDARRPGREPEAIAAYTAPAEAPASRVPPETDPNSHAPVSCLRPESGLGGMVSFPGLKHTSAGSPAEDE